MVFILVVIICLFNPNSYLEFGFFYLAKVDKITAIESQTTP